MAGDEPDTVTAGAAALHRPGPSLSPGQELGSRYTITAELGRGGSGAVYLARDRRTGGQVALKALDRPGWLPEESTEQLFRELRFGRSLTHPNICRIHDVFVVQGRCYLTMEHAQGGTLRATLLERGANRPTAEKLDDARAVIAGLAAIHRAGLVHRDLKPENVLRAASGRLLVSDFGIARALAQTTATTRVAGTPGYLAPETLRGGEPSQTGDVWALGVVLHEILTGVRPQWTGAGWRALLPRQAEDRGQEALARVCRACLSADPRRRPATGAAVQQRLERQLRRRFHLSLRARRLLRMAVAAGSLLLGAAGVRLVLRALPAVSSCSRDGAEVCRLARGLCERWPDASEWCRWPDLDVSRCGIGAARVLDPPNQGLWTTASRPGVRDGPGACLRPVRELCTPAEWQRCRRYGALTCENISWRFCRWRSNESDCNRHADKTCWGLWTIPLFGEGSPRNGVPPDQDGACISELYNLDGPPCP